MVSQVTSLIFSFLTVTFQRDLIVSLEGIDSTTCGYEVPCRTIGYTIEYRANTNDNIMVDNKFSKKGTVFQINTTFTLKQNFTITGINGRPILSSKHPLFLFNNKESSKFAHVWLKVVDLWFSGVALSELHNPQFSTSIEIFRCLVSQLYSLSFINSQVLSPNVDSLINITIQDTNMTKFQNGIKLRGLNVRLNVFNSTFSAGEKRNIGIHTTFANMKAIISLKADCSALKFTDVLAIYFQPRTDNERTSVINISNSVFEGSKHSPDYLWTNGLFVRGTTMNLQNCVINNVRAQERSRFSLAHVNGLFNNCTFKNIRLKSTRSMLSIQSSKVTFRGCLFINNSGDAGYPLKDYFVIKIVKSETLFHNCSFIKNFGRGLVIVLNNYDTNFQNCNFINNFIEKAAVRIFLSRQTINTKFHNCTFISNGAKGIKPGGAVSLLQFGYSVTKFVYCIFANNNAHAGGAVKILDSRTIFQNCSFLNNSANYGGAVHLVPYASGNSEVLLEDSYFEANTARYGGAIRSVSTNVRILHCSFIGNDATAFGGAIMHTGRKLLLKNTMIDTPSVHRPDNLGECIYSLSEVTLESVSFKDSDRSTAQTWMLTATKLIVEANSSINCFQGKKVKVHGFTDWGNNQMQLTYVYCSSCPKSEYSLSSGNATFYKRTSNTRVIKADIKCCQCPFGGKCKRGHIRAAQNFWGYQVKDEVRFITCPFGYCCTGRSCKSYDSCASGRQSTLCGVCSKNLTEDIITSKCLERGSCSHPWYWLLVIFGGISYFLLFMYLQEILSLFKVLLCPKNMKSIFKQTISPANEVPLLTDNQPTSTDVNNDEDSSKPIKENESDVVFPGLFKIFLFFYQVNLLYKVPTTFDEPQHTFGQLKEILATVFNLRTDSVFYQNFSWCPIRDLTPILKVMLKMSFIFYVMSLVFLTYILSLILNWIQTRNCQRELFVKHSRQCCLGKSTVQRLLPCCLRLAFISYATVTLCLLSLLSCVNMHSTSILFIDGTIQCFQWWQYIVVAIVLCWVVSFPVAIYTTSLLLHRKMMSSEMFVLSLVLPISSIIYWLYICFHANKVYVTQSNNDVGAIEREDNWERTSRQLLKDMEGPFRGTESSSINKGSKLFWESIFITRKLALLFAKTFIINTVVRLLVMLLLTIVFVVHHVKVQPFANHLLNYVETASLLMLTIICTLNILPAYTYRYPLATSPFSINLFEAFAKIETVLTLIFPAIALFCIAVLLCIRLFQLMLWLCSILLRISYICLKRKSS